MKFFFLFLGLFIATNAHGTEVWRDGLPDSYFCTWQECKEEDKSEAVTHLGNPAGGAEVTYLCAYSNGTSSSTDPSGPGSGSELPQRPSEMETGTQYLHAILFDCVSCKSGEPTTYSLNQSITIPGCTSDAWLVRDYHTCTTCDKTTCNNTPKPVYASTFIDVGTSPYQMMATAVECTDKCEWKATSYEFRCKDNFWGAPKNLLQGCNKCPTLTDAAGKTFPGKSKAGENKTRADCYLPADATQEIEDEKGTFYFTDQCNAGQ